MMPLVTHIAAGLTAAAIAAGSVFAAGSDEPTPPRALVIDASLARDGRDLVNSRLERLEAEIRIPRNADEARTNVRYFDDLGYRVYVAGAQATAAPEDTGVNATPVAGLDGALKALR